MHLPSYAKEDPTDGVSIALGQLQIDGKIQVSMDLRARLPKPEQCPRQEVGSCSTIVIDVDMVIYNLEILMIVHEPRQTAS